MLQQLSLEFKQFALELVDAAAEISRYYFRNKLDIDVKAGNYPVTIADREIELKLRHMINTRYPNHGIVGEECANYAEYATYVWVIDPIDGTVAFTTGKATFTTLVALLVNNKPVIGVIDQPINCERFVAFLDEGSHAHFLHLGNKAWSQKLTASSHTDLNMCRLNATTPDMFTEKEKSIFDKLKSQVKLCGWGGDAYAYCLLASGYIDIIMESQLQYYDVAALTVLVKQSGGVITTWQGDNIDLHDFNGQCLASCNKIIHEKALKIINN